MSFRPCLQAGGGNPSVRVTLTGGSKIAWFTSKLSQVGLLYHVGQLNAG